MRKTAEVEIVKQGENKFEFKVNGIKVMVFLQFKNALDYEEELKELNPFVEFINKHA